MRRLGMLSGGAIAWSVGLLLGILSPSGFGTQFVLGVEKARADESPPAKKSAPSGLSVPLRGVEPEGRRVVSGVRIESGGPGGLRIAETSFPAGGAIQFLELPPSLGGGFLFAQPVAMGTSVRTTFFRSDSFTGALEPLFSVGLAQLELFAREHSVILKSEVGVFELEFDPPRLTRVAFPPYALEPSELHFLGTQAMLLEAPLFGVLLSTDAGRTFTKLENGTKVIPSSAEAPRLVRGESFYRIDADGVLRLDVKSPRPTASRKGIVAALGEVLERGVRREGAVEARSLSFELTLDEGSLKLEGREKSVARGSCVGLTTITPEPRFLCRDAEQVRIVDREGTTLLDLSGQRRVESFGRGGVVLGPPLGNAAVSSLLAVLERKAGRYETFEVPKLDRGRYVVVDGELLSIERSSSGIVVREPKRAASEPKTFEFPREEGLRTWLLHADLVPAARRNPEGIGLFFTRDDEFVGVRLKKEGALEVGPIKRGLSRAVFHGERAIVWGAAGYAQESIDGGGTYSDVLLPYQSGDGDPNAFVSDSEVVKMGCTSVGCRLGRVASLLGDALGSNTPVSPPQQLLPVPSKGIHRLHFDCDLVEVATAPSKKTEKETFWGAELSPVPPHFSRLVHKSVDDGAYLLSEGPSGIAWNLEGRTTIWAHDPFSTPLRKSHTTLGLFASQTEAEAALGLLDPAGSTATLALSADGTAALYRILDRDRIQEVLSVEGRPLELMHRIPAELRTHRLSLAHHLSETYLSAQDTEGLTLYSKQGSEWVVRARYPLPRGQTLNLGIATDVHGAVAVTLLRDAILYAYPILSTMELGFPLTLSLGDKNRACTPSSEGYLIVTESSLTPDFAATRGPLSLTRVYLRHRLGPGGGCLDAIAGRARGAFTPGVRNVRSSRSVPLIVSDYGEETSEAYLCE